MKLWFKKNIKHCWYLIFNFYKSENLLSMQKLNFEFEFLIFNLNCQIFIKDDF